VDSEAGRYLKVNSNHLIAAGESSTNGQSRAQDDISQLWPRSRVH
jgi:hypothetical protein